MFKLGDRVTMKSLGQFDGQAGVRVGMAGTVKNIQGGFVIPGDAAYVVFDEHLIGVHAGNTRWIGVACLELVPAAPKLKGFQVGDRVIVVRGNDITCEMESLHDEKLFGRFGVITAVKDAVYDYAVRFENFEGWGNGQWGINKTNLRRVTVQNVNG